KTLLKLMSERLFVAFGYLHSRLSASIEVLPPPSSQGPLKLEGRANPESRRVVRALVQKLSESREYLKAVPLRSQVKLDLPGGGIRSGGCFPMRSAPVGLETDLWGRIADLPHVYIIDSSVLPTIPAGPIAFTAMANAHRIASECPID